MKFARPVHKQSRLWHWCWLRRRHKAGPVHHLELRQELEMLSLGLSTMVRVIRRPRLRLPQLGCTDTAWWNPHRPATLLRRAWLSHSSGSGRANPCRLAPIRPAFARRIKQKIQVGSSRRHTVSAVSQFYKSPLEFIY